jgi:hypothetical protein
LGMDKFSPLHIEASPPSSAGRSVSTTWRRILRLASTMTGWTQVAPTRHALTRRHLVHLTPAVSQWQGSLTISFPWVFSCACLLEDYVIKSGRAQFRSTRLSAWTCTTVQNVCLLLLKYPTWNEQLRKKLPRNQNM